MLLGIQTNKAWGQADFDLILPAGQGPRFKSAKLYQIHGCRHSEAEVMMLRRLGVEHFTMRLGDSIYEPDSAHPTRWLRDPVGYAEDHLRLIVRFRAAGVRDYIIDNEPNITWTRMGMGFTPQQYAQWLDTMIRYMRHRRMYDGWDLPADVRIGYPPIAWTDEYPHMPYLEALTDVAHQFDFLAVHSYFQSDRLGLDNILAGPLRWERFGANYLWYMRKWPGIPVQVAEWGNSVHERGVFTPEQVSYLRAIHYPIWLQYAEREGVEASHVYIGPGATDDWAGFKVTEDVARAMAAFRALRLPVNH